jgi:FixJ family two-component response regulator
VFIVEDDEAVSQATAQLVDLLGYQAEAYDFADAFLRAYEPTRPACLVADVRMTGMSGLEL